VYTGFWWGNLSERDHLEDLGIDGRRMRWAGRVARMGKRRGVYRVLVGKPEGKRPLGGPRRRWEENEMGGTCSTYGEEERCIQGFGGKTRGKETTWRT